MQHPAIRFNVSIHVPARGTTGEEMVVEVKSMFQSTFPQGERRNCPQSRLWITQFQSTFPQGERRWEMAPPSDKQSFNPRSRKGNDTKFHWEKDIVLVSIHVPARGTTTLRRCLCEAPEFQSTFPQGERPNLVTIPIQR